VDAGVGVARVEVGHAAGAPEPARLEEEGDFPVRDLVAVQPEIADEDAMEWALVGGVVVAPHPEGAGRDEHDAVGASGRGPGRGGSPMQVVSAAPRARPAVSTRSRAYDRRAAMGVNVAR
jgi:hypothetical protein